MLKKTTAIITALLFIALLLAGCSAAEKLTEYDFGTDKVPSINAVLGETRKVNGVSTGTENGVQYKQYDYKSESVEEDLITYTMHLRDSGWVVTQDYDLTLDSGEAQLAIESADSGKILVISIAFEQTAYAIRVNKLDGTLTTDEESE